MPFPKFIDKMRVKQSAFKTPESSAIFRVATATALPPGVSASKSAVKVDRNPQNECASGMSFQHSEHNIASLSNGDCYEDYDPIYSEIGNNFGRPTMMQQTENVNLNSNLKTMDSQLKNYKQKSDLPNESISSRIHDQLDYKSPVNVTCQPNEKEDRRINIEELYAKPVKNVPVKMCDVKRFKGEKFKPQQLSELERQVLLVHESVQTVNNHLTKEIKPENSPCVCHHKTEMNLKETDDVIHVSKSVWDQIKENVDNVIRENVTLSSDVEKLRLQLKIVEKDHSMEVTKLGMLNQKFIDEKKELEEEMNKCKIDKEELIQEIGILSLQCHQSVSKRQHDDALHECLRLLEKLKVKQAAAEDKLMLKLKRSEEETVKLALEVTELKSQLTTQQVHLPHVYAAYEDALTKLHTMSMQLDSCVRQQKTNANITSQDDSQLNINGELTQQVIQKNLEAQVLVKKLCKKLQRFGTTNKF